MAGKKNTGTRSSRKRRNTITIAQIAEEVGVSTATVSRVINSPHQVRENTRERILKLLQERHYVSDARAASLASQRSHTIGLLIPTIVNSIYAAFTQATQQVCQSAGYTVLIGITEYEASTEFELVTRLLERRVDGLILTGVKRDSKLYERIHHMHVPFITTWRSSRYQDIPSFSFSNYRAATIAVEHLIDLGHKNIGLICGQTDRNDRALERKRAYIDTMAAHGLTITDTMMHEREFEFTEGWQAMEKMLGDHPEISAVFCANDIQAVGAIHACRDRGLQVPADVSIIGFDNHPITEHVSPQLTTISVPAHEMGKLAGENLIDAIDTQRTPKSRVLDVKLVIRESTAAPADC